MPTYRSLATHSSFCGCAGVSVWQSSIISGQLGMCAPFGCLGCGVWPNPRNLGFGLPGLWAGALLIARAVRVVVCGISKAVVSTKPAFMVPTKSVFLGVTIRFWGY